MRAYTLNGARERMNAGPETGSIIDEIPSGVVVTTPEVGDMDAFAANIPRWATTGKTLQQTAPGLVGDFPFDKVLEAAASGAALGSAGLGFGIAVGVIASVAIVVGEWFVRNVINKPSRWDQAGPHVHWWFTNYAPQAYLDWIDSTESFGLLASVSDAAKGLVNWHLSNGKVLWQGSGHSSIVNGVNDDGYVMWAYYGMYDGSPDWVAAREAMRDFYRGYGIDWNATNALYVERGSAGGPFVLLKRVILMDDGTEIDGAPGAGDSGGSISNSTKILAAVAAIGAAAVVLPPLLKPARNG